jgi:hypothetical protein
MECANLLRRLQLVLPLTDDAYRWLALLDRALAAARRFLHTCRCRPSRPLQIQGVLVGEECVQHWGWPQPWTTVLLEVSQDAVEAVVVLIVLVHMDVATQLLDVDVAVAVDVYRPQSLAPGPRCPRR